MLRPEHWYRRLFGDGTSVIIALLAVLFAIFVWTQNDALTQSVLTDIFNNSLPLALAAAGGTLVVLTRGFDLSVAGVVSLTNVLVAVYAGDGPLGALGGLAIAVVVGGLVGAVNGVLIAYLNLQSIALTLSSMIVCSGAALLILDAPGGNVSDFMVYGLTDQLAGVIPVALAIAVVVYLIWVVLLRTNWGVGLYAIGADETAAVLAGVPAARTKVIAYVLAGVCYGLAGFMLTALTATGTPNVGDPYLLLVFAAIALGGTSFSGGRGGIAGSMLGALTLTLLQKVLFSTGVSSFYTGIFQGAVMIIAVVIAAVSARFSSNREGHA
ncbi:ribose transport system permease protein [Rhizobium sp. BK313]|uniref:ABC transporter permease n=1 Tax=Rhizobium sp. BK313 TaxID=2587081 RepID=UPI00179B04B9|nr:ABC transporter permease [Rhizobium sp. BK313]MBB3458329.1 ribose transport system permease protein [Rhizobium sp. BK313]